MSSAYTSTPETLLIVEKDAHTTYLLNYMLRREGYDVVSSSHCGTTLSMLKTMDPPKAVFLDISFIREHDCIMIETIRKTASWRHVPVLLLAEQHDMDYVQAALQAGASDFIMQPFNAAELIYHIKTHALSA